MTTSACVFFGGAMLPQLMANAKVSGGGAFPPSA